MSSGEPMTDHTAGQREPSAPSRGSVEENAGVRDSRNAKTTDHDAAPAAIVPEPEPSAARRRPAGGTGDTVHGASPEARAESDEDRTDKAATSHRRDGTGDTPATHATQGECSKPREGKEPVAWAAIRENGQPLWLSYDRSGAEGMVNGMAEVVPLYRSPTLTDAEREAVEWAATHLDNCGWGSATLRGLLERMK